MNSLVRDHLPASFFDGYQMLRNQLTDVLHDEDLAFRPGDAVPTLGEVCVEIGEVEHSYIEAFRTFRQDFTWRNPDRRVGREVAALTAWYAQLDRDLLTALSALTEDDIANRRVVRSDWDPAEFSPLPWKELDIYREALLIFCGRVSVYLRMLGRDLPGYWPLWIG